MIHLKGKIALVTGGSRGIGAATVMTLAQAGCHVAFTYSRSRKNALQIQSRVEGMGRRCLVLQANVALETDVKRAVKKTLSAFGAIDILVNNAGIWKYGAIGSMTAKQWDETLNINLKGTFLFCNEVIKSMKRRGGKIVNVASTAGQRGEAYHSHYAASKGGMIAFTRSIAVEAAVSGINVNCVSPGWVETDMSAETLSDNKTRKQIEASIPRGRVATPREIADTILFLSSPLADHLVGSVVSVNGGGVMVS